jgi:hypothetical protein
MASHSFSPGDPFATLRASLQAESASALGSVVIALILRLCTELEHLFAQFRPRRALAPASFLSTRATRFSGLAFLPRALRRPRLPLWLLRLAPAVGLRPAPLPRPQSRAARAHPLRNAPH